MKILIVAATRAEIEPVLSAFRGKMEVLPAVSRLRNGSSVADFLVTGVGMVATAAATAAVLCSENYDLAVNAGICGSFSNSLAPGEAVNVISDFFPEAGAEDGDRFLTLQELGLLSGSEPPYENGKIVNSDIPEWACTAGLKKVTAATVNTVHGNEPSISRFRQQHAVDTESMEGAAFMYACKLLKVRFIQIRSVSNYITRRDRSQWNIPLAVKNLNELLLQLLLETKVI